MITRWVIKPPLRLIRRITFSRKGNVAIEFGFMVPIFILLTLAAVELGRLGSEWTRAKHAAQAGTQYGVQDQVNAKNIPAIEAAAHLDAGDTANPEFEITARPYYRCPESASDELNGSTKCADDTYSPLYVEVTVKRSLAPLVPYLSLPQSYAISVTNTARVR